MSKAKPLTKAEKAWLKELEAVFARCPSKRIGMYTIGDADLHIFDKLVSEAWHQENPREELDMGAHHKLAGSNLGFITTGGIQIDSGAG